MHCPLTAACIPTPSPCNRRQRLGMVQTREQYLFCHTALLAFVRQLAQQAQHGTQQVQHDGVQARQEQQP